MAVSVSFNGNTFSIPEAGDTGWGSLTDYLIALSAAQTSTSSSSSVSISTSYSIPLGSTATIILADSSGGALSVVLPPPSGLGTYTVKDSGGASSTLPITILPNGSETLDGASLARLSSSYGSLTFVSDGTNWFIL